VRIRAAQESTRSAHRMPNGTSTTVKCLLKSASLLPVLFSEMNQMTVSTTNTDNTNGVRLPGKEIAEAGKISIDRRGDYGTRPASESNGTHRTYRPAKTLMVPGPAGIEPATHRLTVLNFAPCIMHFQDCHLVFIVD
jgi:hypothetical protein